MFFNKETMESLRSKVERRNKKILDTADIIKDTKDLIEELIKNKV